MRYISRGHDKFEDLNNSSTSLINSNSQTDLPSIETSPMAHMLVQQQTPNINIHQTKSTHDENLSPMAHSADDRLFFYKPDSASLLHFLQRFASEPQMSKFSSASNGFLDQNLSFLPLNNPEEEEIIAVNVDQIQPVITEETKSNELDNISIATTIDALDQDILLNTDSSLNTERHFRRRKRRSSLLQTSSLNDEIEPIITDSIEQIQEDKSPEIKENLPPISIENLSGRRLRFRSHRHTSSTSEEPISDNTVQFSLPTETPPLSPTVNVPSPLPSPTSLTGGLKRTHSIGTTKKMVRFADSVGRELAQVQYIQPSTEEDGAKELSFLKNNLYVPKSSPFEHKPWSFDVALTSKSDTPIPRRFFCLFRQPSSEHPDIYLHEIWKSQIKLEHADIRLKSFSTGEQFLYGTCWVTNASYWKNVTVKYSFNRWMNTYEYEARYLCHSNDFRNIDQFEFSIDIPNDVDRIDFVLRYSVNGQEHWDNNEGKNYTLETESASIPPTTISLPRDCDFNEMRFY